MITKTNKKKGNYSSRRLETTCEFNCFEQNTNTLCFWIARIHSVRNTITCGRPFLSREIEFVPLHRFTSRLLLFKRYSPWILIDVTEIESPFFFRRYRRIATLISCRGLKFANELNFSFNTNISFSLWWSSRTFQILKLEFPSFSKSVTSTSISWNFLRL